MSSPELPTSAIPTGVAWGRAFRLLIAIASLVWGSMCLLFGSLGPSDGSYAILFFVLLNFQCSLLGLWAGLGSSRWRWLWIAIATPTLGFLPVLNTGNEVAEFMVYCFVIVSIVAITTLLLRLTQGRLQLLRADVVAVDALRFGIRDLILWTAVAALILSKPLPRPLYITEK